MGHILTIDPGELRRFGPDEQGLTEAEARRGARQASAALVTIDVSRSVTGRDYVMDVQIRHALIRSRQATSSSTTVVTPNGEYRFPVISAPQCGRYPLHAIS